MIDAIEEENVTTSETEEADSDSQDVTTGRKEDERPTHVTTVHSMSLTRDGIKCS